MDDEREPDPDEIDYLNIDDEEEVGRDGRVLRAAVWILSASIVVVMIAVPLFRVIDLGEDNDPETAAMEARAFVAARFAEAALERRSTRLAVRWALPALYEQVDDVVGFLQTREESLLEGAEASVARVECGARAADDVECFHTWLRRPGEPDIIRVRLVVGIVDGSAVVVDLEAVQSAYSWSSFPL